MGDEVFTDEEKVILGEKEPPAPTEKGPETPPADGVKPPEGDKTEPKPEEVPTDEEKQAAEAQGFKLLNENGKTYFIDDEGMKVPAKRFKAVYREREDAKRTIEEKERKFNLFRELGPEKYYEVYPGEKPQGWKPPEKPKEEKVDFEDLGSMIVKGGPHDGKTLNEVYQENPAYAQRLQYEYLTAKSHEAESAKQTEERIRKESEEEVNAFTTQVSKELFGKETEKLSPQEQVKVKDTIQGVLDWMHKTKRGGGMLADAYFLMNKDGIIADARTKGGKEALESLKKASVPSVDTRGGATVSGFGAFEGMTADQLAAEVEKMNEKEYQKFMKEAPQTLRSKHPGLPWS